MKYLLLNSLKAGGAERVAQVLATTGLFDGVILLEKDCDYRINLPMYFLSEHTWRTNRIFKTLFLPIYAMRMRKYVKKSDVVVSFAERANFANVLSGLFNGSKPVLTLHINMKLAFQSRLKSFYSLLIKFLYPKAAAIVSVSRGIDASLDNIIQYPGIKRVIYNPVNLEQIRLAAAAELEPEWVAVFNHPVLVNVGRLAEQKAQWNLLRIFKGVLEKNPDTKLILLGDGELYGRLIGYSQKLGLKVFDNRSGKAPDEWYDVYFLGYRDNPYKFYSRSSAFVLSSLYEGLPMAIIEAMACGLPVVSSDCDFGPREILAPGSSLNSKPAALERARFGLLLPVPVGGFENFDSQVMDSVWVETLSSFLGDTEARHTYSKLSRQRAEDFSMEKIVEQWQELFKRIEVGK